ncbi:MAG: nuclear transport factor 2 family protein [Acidobacteria bacterium]|nr:nuclear transport factor 2 family protein [Acidobacteriota bacterium]
MPSADDLRFDNPISGKGVGAEGYRRFLSGFLPSINQIETRQIIAEGEFVAVHWDADTIFGIISVLQMCRIREGMITDSVTISIRVRFWAPKSNARS